MLKQKKLDLVEGKQIRNDEGKLTWIIDAVIQDLKLNYVEFLNEKIF